MESEPASIGMRMAPHRAGLRVEVSAYWKTILAAARAHLPHGLPLIDRTRGN